MAGSGSVAETSGGRGVLMRRYPRSVSMRRRICLVVAAGLLVTQSLAPAFDTGHHEDLTATVMSERGFGEVPTQIVQVAN